MKLSRVDSQSVHHTLAVPAEELIILLSQKLGVEIPDDAEIVATKGNLGRVTGFAVNWKDHTEQVETTEIPTVGKSL